MVLIRLPTVCATAIILFAAACHLCAADRLILRNLDVIADRTVVSFDEDGLLLDALRPGGGERVTWDEVERGRVSLEQERFDKLLAELGPPLFRIRQRLKIGDYAALAEPAEAMYPRFAERRSQTAYMVCQAAMWSRIASGRREAAVEPYVRCYELLRSRAATINGLPGSRRLQTDPATAISAELVPVWFDAAAAKAVLPGLQAAIRSLAMPRPEGVSIYYASLALAAGETAEAQRILSAMTSDDPQLAAWRDVLAAQQELAANSPGTATSELRARLDSLPGTSRAGALYWLGLADSQGTDAERSKDGILLLLTLPAEYVQEQPELAAAGLYHAALALAKLKEERGAAAVRGELAGRYGGTLHAAKLRAATPRAAGER
jgi:hypothetical protein